MKHVICLIGCLSMLSACGNGSAIGNSAGSFSGSSLFGKRDEEAVVVPRIPQVVDTRAFVPVVRSAKLDRTKGGSILRVVGDTGVQGYYEVELVLAQNQEGNAIVYEFRAAAPNPGQTAPTQRSKEVQAAVFVSDLDNVGARAIVVQAQQNKVTLRR